MKKTKKNGFKKGGTKNVGHEEQNHIYEKNKIYTNMK
jgi:hypothetical protein